MVEAERTDKMTQTEPYFMKNDEWYYFDEADFKYKLTDKAPKEAIDSYNKFYDVLEQRTED